MPDPTKKPKSRAKKRAKFDIVKSTEAVLAMAPDDPSHEPLLTELSDEERLVLRYRLRGITQTEIAKYMGVSQPRVAQIIKKIRQYHLERGTDISQAVVIGETQSYYDFLTEKAWGFLAQAEASPEGTLQDKRDSLKLLLDIKKNNLKSMMDLGILKQANVPERTNNTLIISPFMEKLGKQGTQELAKQLIDMTQDPLEEPEPPEEEEIYVEAKETE